MTPKNGTIRRSKTALIIGGTSGIGLETACLFSSDHDVVIIGRNAEKIADNPTLHRSLTLSVDIRDFMRFDELSRCLADIGVDKVVHCAGIFRRDDSEDEAYRAAYRATKMGGVELIRRLMALDPGHITHVCAVSSLFTLMPDTLAPFFERGVQKEMEEAILCLRGVITNCVAPSLVRTPMIEAAYKECDIEGFLAHSPGSRILEPIEVAREIYFLCNQNTITGKVIPVDGGYLNNLII